MIRSRAVHRLLGVLRQSKQPISVLCLVVLVLTLGVDTMFTAASAVIDLHGRVPYAWHVSSDRGYAEQWQYAKWAMLVAMLSVMALRRSSAVYAAWAAVFLYLLGDDSRQFHETYGNRLATHFSFPSAMGLRPQDFGELLVTGIAGGLLFGLVALTASRSSRSDVSPTRGLLVLCALLVVFGVGVDMVDIMVGPGKARVVLSLLEDAGEMGVASLIVCYVLDHALLTAVRPPVTTRLPSANDQG